MTEPFANPAAVVLGAALAARPVEHPERAMRATPAHATVDSAILRIVFTFCCQDSCTVDPGASLSPVAYV